VCALIKKNSVTFVLFYHQASGLPGSALAGHLECRVIVRDITGKYVWDSAILHGLQSDSKWWQKRRKETIIVQWIILQ